MTGKKSKVLLVGWDAADWQIINPLLEQGKMPALARLLNKGAWGNLVTLDPPISPMLWTSIATGKRPYKHGISGFTEIAPNKKTVRPVRVTSRKCKAVWNILNDYGLNTNVIGWWPSHPAEKVRGVCVSNFYGVLPKDETDDWPLLKGTVFPEIFADELAELRLNPNELTADIMRNFFPHAPNLFAHNDAVLRSCMRILAHATSIQAVATHVMDNTDWDFTAVYFDALDHFSHLGMKYHPPKLEAVSDVDFQKYHYIVEAAYRFHDMMLDRLMDLAGDDCTVMLVSDHGFESGRNRMIMLPNEPGAPALEHRAYGVFAAGGNMVKPGQVYGASLLDVAPTILNLFGLSTAKDMDGNSIQCIDKEVDKAFIESYDSIDETESSAEEFSSIDQQLLVDLEELGYIKPLSPNAENEIILTENEFYMARSLADGGKLEEALSKMNRLVNLQPETERFANFYATLLLRANKLIDLELWLQTQKSSDFTNYIQGLVYLQQGKPLLAARKFEEFSTNTNANLHLQTARAWLQAGNIDLAKKHAQQSLKLSPENTSVLNLLGNLAWQMQAWEEALGWYFNSLKLLYYQPHVHDRIGQCFVGLNLLQEASNAFEVSLKMQPNNTAVYQSFTEVLKALGISAESNFKRVHENVKPAIVVTGFPRSGTSMMMQILNAAGVPLLVDDVRKPDANNPNGYFELEAVKSTASNQKYLNKAAGKAVKIVMPLLRLVNPTMPLKVIWMDRPIDQILKSQETMLGKPSSAINLQQASRLKEEQERVETWLNQHPHISYLKLDYNVLVGSPEKQLQKLLDFLQINIDLKTLIKEIKPKN